MTAIQTVCSVLILLTCIVIVILIRMIIHSGEDGE